MDANDRNSLGGFVENSDEEYRKKMVWNKLILLDKPSANCNASPLTNSDDDNDETDNGKVEMNSNNSEESTQQKLPCDDNFAMPNNQNYIDINTGVSVFVLDKSKTLILQNTTKNDTTTSGSTSDHNYPLKFISNTSKMGYVSSNFNGRKIYSMIENETKHNYLLPTLHEWGCFFNLPYGFEIAISSTGELYFLNYNNSTTTNSIDLDKIVYSGRPTHYRLGNYAPNLDWGRIIDNDCKIIKSIPPNPVGTLMENSMLVKKFKIGDRIISINNKPVQYVDDIKNIFVGLFRSGVISVNIEMIREFKMTSVDSTSSDTLKSNVTGTKPAILSEMRKASNKMNKLSVHFAEKPVILEYQRERVRKQTESNTIEIKFDNVIRIKLETGMVKTIKVTNNHTVYNVIERVLGKLNYQHLEIFCLALVDSTQCHVHYFSHHQKMEKILKYKKDDVTLECRILVLHPPDDIRSWLTPEWAPCFDYLFFQYRNELLSGNVVKNDLMTEKTLLHLIAFVVATDNMVECLNKLEIYVDKKSRDQTMDTLTSNGIHNLVIPSSFLVNVDYRIKFLCKSISAASLNQNVLRIFSDLLPQPFFQLIFAETKQLDDIHFRISSPVFNEFKYITRDAQSAFLQLANQFNLVGIHRFRVHVISCPGVHIQESSFAGLPFHFYIDFQSGYGIIKDTSNFTMLVGDFNSVLGIYVYYNGDGRRIVSILSKKESPLTFIASERECDNIILFMRSICSMKSDEYHCKTLNNSHQSYILPVIDFTDLNNRVGGADLPPFFNYNHLTIPSTWNHSASVEEFTTTFWPYFKRFSLNSTNQSSKLTDSVADSDAVSYDILSNKTDNSGDKLIYDKIDTLIPYLITLKRGYVSSVDTIMDQIFNDEENSSDVRIGGSDDDDDDDETDSLSKNPWITKLVSADEVDIRRRNSLTKTTNQQNDVFRMNSSTSSSHEANSEAIGSIDESNYDKSIQSNEESLQLHSNDGFLLDHEPTEETCDGDNKINVEPSVDVIVKNSPLPHDSDERTQSNRLTITTKLIRAISRMTRKNKSNFTTRKNSHS